MCVCVCVCVCVSVGQTVAKVRARRGLTAFLYDKTGVTGAWTLGIGVSAYLISKEYYVMNGEVPYIGLY